MHNNNDSRRKTIKALSTIGTAGAIGLWTKPIVRSVVLPAHAQTSAPIVVAPTAAAVTIADVAMLESSAFTVTATLNIAVPGGFTVDISTSDIDATTGADYIPIVGMTLNFTGTAGEMVDFNIVVVDDPTLEPNESLMVSMSNLLGNSVPVDISDTATIVINNDD